jgi:hypothetical protein
MKRYKAKVTRTVWIDISEEEGELNVYEALSSALDILENGDGLEDGSTTVYSSLKFYEQCEDD